LGAKFIGLGARGAEQRLRLREVLSDIAGLAIQEHVDVVLIAGDAFDSNQASRESLEAFQSFLRQMAERHITVVAIAGTHDCLEPNALLVRVAKNSQGNLVLLTPEQPLWRSPQGHCVVQGVSLTASDEPKRPLSGLRATPEPVWQLGMAHASLEIGRDNGREAVISPSEIAATGLDYLALGHWHGLRDCSQGKTACWFSGAPEMTAMDLEKCGHVLLVTLEEGRLPVVEPQRVGKRSLQRLSMAVDQTDVLLEQLRGQADPNAVLELTLTGMTKPENKPDLAYLHAALSDLFFYVRLKDGSLAENLGDLQTDYPETTIAGRFVRLVEQERALHPENGEELDQALHLGLALLAGREVAL